MDVLNDNSLLEHIRKCGVTDRGIELINKIRKGDPVRRVSSGGLNNVTRFASKKMNRVIQAESDLEYAFIVSFEMSELCIEYYDQPSEFEVILPDGAKKKFIPDLLSIERTGVVFYEFRLFVRMMNLVKKTPNLYSFDNKEKVFRSLPYEGLLGNYGFKYVIKTEKSFSNELAFNNSYIYRYFSDVKESRSGIFNEVLSLFGKGRVLSLSQIFELHSDVTVNDILYMIAHSLLYFDMYNIYLTDTESICITNDRELFFSVQKRFSLNRFLRDNDLSIGSVFHVDSYSYCIYFVSDDSFYGADRLNNKRFFRKNEIYQMIKSGELKVTSGVEDGLDPINSQSEKEINILKKYKSCIEYLESGVKYKNVCEIHNVSERTLRRKKNDFDEARKKYGVGIFGILRKIRKRGNRRSRYKEEEEIAIHKIIEDLYRACVGRSVTGVHETMKHNFPDIKISNETLRRWIRKGDHYYDSLRREGRKKSLSKMPFVGSSEYSNPRHGCRAFDKCHLDHTQLEIEIVMNGNKSARPWVSVIIDAYTKAVVAFFVSFWSPNAYTCMQVLRNMVARHHRLPSTLIVDGGKEFQSESFQSLCALYSVNITYRNCNPRKGCIVERFFLSVQTRLIHQMAGNTKWMKDPRSQTKAVNPKTHAIHRLSNIHGFFEKYCFEVYNNEVHSSTEEEPNESESRSFAAHGDVNYLDSKARRAFFYDAMIPVDCGGFRIVSEKGIKDSNAYYWNDEFKKIETKGLKVAVRKDCFKDGVVFCLLNGEWIECVGQKNTGNNKDSPEYDYFLGRKPNFGNTKGMNDENKYATISELMGEILMTEESLLGSRENNNHSKSVRRPGLRKPKRDVVK